MRKNVSLFFCFVFFLLFLFLLIAEQMKQAQSGSFVSLKPLKEDLLIEKKIGGLSSFSFARSSSRFVAVSSGDLFLGKDYGQESNEHLKIDLEGKKVFLSPVISEDGMSALFFAGNERAQFFLYRWEEGFSLEKLLDHKFSGTWQIVDQGARVFLVPKKNAQMSGKRQDSVLLLSLKLNQDLLGAKRVEVQLAALSEASDVTTFDVSQNQIRLASSSLRKNAYKRIALKSHLPIFDLDKNGVEDLLTFQGGFSPPFWRAFLQTEDNPASKFKRGQTAFTTLRLGHQEGIPVPADYDGDGVLDIGTFRPNMGYAWNVDWQNEDACNWQIYFSSGSLSKLAPNKTLHASYCWGHGQARAVPADYDGDGRADLAVFDPLNGVWQIAFSAPGFNLAKAKERSFPYGVEVSWGKEGDLPVVADYNGDGRADLALYEPETSIWKFAYLDSEGKMSRTRKITFGKKGDIAVPLDYDCDGSSNLVLYRPSEKKWFVLYSKDKQETIDWGVDGGEPFSGDFDGDACPDLALFKPKGPEHFYILQSSMKKFAREYYRTALTWGFAETLPIAVAQRRHYLLVE